MTQPAVFPSPIPRDAILQLVSDLADCQTNWTTDAQDVSGLVGDKQAWIELSITNYAAKGIDEQRVAGDPVTGDLDIRIGGYRLFTVSMRCKSYDSDWQPYDLLERVRWGLRSQYAMNVIRPLGIALVSFNPISVFSVRANVETDNRLRIDAVMDVRFARAVNGTPVDDGRTIRTVNSGGPIPGSLT